MIVLCVTAANAVLYRMPSIDNPEAKGLDAAILGASWRIMADLAIKVVGFVITVTIFLPAIVLSVLVTLLFHVIRSRARG